MRIMAVGAHPDDLEIFMFGTLAQYAEAGARLSLVVVTDGAKGGAGDPESLARIRRDETIGALAPLGCEPSFFDFPDGALTADAHLIDRLGEAISSQRPDVIFTHAPNDYHRDHRALSEAVRMAASFAAPVIHADTLMGVGFAPTHYVDISDKFEAKEGAIRAHVSQDPERFVEMARLQNHFRAAQCNGELHAFAEAFRFEPTYPYADIRDLLPPAPHVRPVARRDV